MIFSGIKKEHLAYFWCLFKSHWLVVVQYENIFNYFTLYSLIIIIIIPVSAPNISQHCVIFKFPNNNCISFTAFDIWQHCIFVNAVKTFEKFNMLLIVILFIILWNVILCFTFDFHYLPPELNLILDIQLLDAYMIIPDLK